MSQYARKTDNDNDGDAASAANDDNDDEVKVNFIQSLIFLWYFKLW